MKSTRSDAGGRFVGSEPAPSGLSAALERVRPRLGRLASTILFFPAIGSTNDVVSELIARQPDDVDGLVVVAEAQTAGRGRRGHAWFSPPGSGLYVSVALAAPRAPDPARAMQLLTLAAGVGLADAIETSCGLRAELKWPNDLYVGTRKIAGILAEAALGTRHVVVGFGVNVGAMAYPPELQDRATSLESELGRAIDRYEVLAETLAAVASRYGDLAEGRFDAILDAWRQRAPRSAGARVTWSDASGSQSGVTMGIDECGALLVRTERGVERIVSGEVRWS